MQKTIRRLFVLAVLLGCLFQAKAQSYLLNESFEDELFPPQGWTVLDADGDGHTWLRGVTNLDKHTGSAVAASFTLDPDSWPFTYYAQQDNWLITPPIEVTGDAYRLVLYYCAEDLDTREPFEVRVSTTGTQPSDFTDVLASEVASNGYEDDIVFSRIERSLSAYQGQTICVAIRHTGVRSYALGIDDVQVMNMRGPQRVSGLTATAAAAGQLAATLSWTNPTANGNGEALEAFDVLISRDGELIATLKNQETTYTDNSVSTGRHTYEVRASTAEGPSQARTATVYVGEDVPAAVTALLATIDHGRVHLSWTAPAQGANGGYVDSESLVYEVCRVVDGNATMLATDLAATTFDEQLSDGLTAYYTVAARNATGTGEAAKSNNVVSFINTFTEVSVGADATNFVGNPRLPINMWGGRTGISQTLYYPDDMQYATGQIHHIIYKNSFGTSSNFTARPLKIYMGQTTQADLSAGWVAIDGQQLVFDGTVALPYGDNDIDIELTAPFSYGGDNLVVTVVAPDHTVGAYFDRFYVLDNTAHANRSRLADTGDLSVLASTTGTLSAAVPYTRFALEGEGVATVSGTVTDAATALPLAGVQLSVDGLNLQTTTDAGGRYILDNVKSGAQTFRLAATGYAVLTETVNVPKQGCAVQDFQLTPLPQVTLSGLVKAGDTGLPLQGATVTAGGYDTARTTTLADGTFALTLYDGQDYSLTVSRPNYDVYRSDELSVADSPLSITLERSLTPPFGVEAAPVADGSAAIVCWQKPTDRTGRTQLTRWGESLLHDYMLTEYYSDHDYYVAHAWTAQDTQDSAMVGQSFLGLRVYMQATSGEFTATVWRGTRADHEPVFEQPIPLGAISSEGGWVDITFAEPVEIRQGEDYMVGVHAFGADDQDVFGVNGSWDSPIEGKNNVKWSYVAYTYNSLYALNIAARVGVPATEAGVSAADDSTPACQYNVYRRARSDSEWTRLTAAPTAETQFADADWTRLPSESYLYRVTAVYQQGESLPAYSDTLVRAIDTDAGVVAFVQPVKQTATVSQTPVSVLVHNYGEKPLGSIPVACTVTRLDGDTPDTHELQGTLSQTLNHGEEAEVSLGTIDLELGVYQLTATTTLPGDAQSSNDAFTLTLSNQPNVTLQAMRWNAYGNAGPITIESNVPEQAAFKKEVTPGESLIIAGEYFENRFYAFTATWWSEPQLFAVLDPASWTQVSTTATTDFVQDMAYDYANDRMLAIAVNSSNESTLATVNLKNGELTLLGSTGLNLHTLACNTQGEIFAVSDGGLLYQLDPKSGKPSLVGDTGVGDTKYLQSMAFDHASGRLFWVHTSDTIDGELFELSPLTARSQRLGEVLWQGEASEIVGLYTPYDKASSGVERATSGTAATGTAAIYDLRGVRHERPRHGLQLLRQADGTVRKVFVR